MKSIIYGDDKGMFGDFFRYWDELPQDGGFRLFGWIHICWLVGILFVCIVTGYYYRKAERIRLELRNKVAAGDLSVTYKGLCDCYMEMATKKNKERERRICNKIALICIEKCIEIRKKEIKNGNMKLNINQLYQIKKRILKLLE